MGGEARAIAQRAIVVRDEIAELKTEVQLNEQVSIALNAIVEDRQEEAQRVIESLVTEGLHSIFTAAGFEWRQPGCSMCLAMNADRLEPGERCASTSNRNFEGRQGAGGRTHLVSPAMAAAAAMNGHFVDVRRIA